MITLQKNGEKSLMNIFGPNCLDELLRCDKAHTKAYADFGRRNKSLRTESVAFHFSKGEQTYGLCMLNKV